MAVAPALQIGDKLIFALVEGDRQDGDFPTAPDVKERLEQVLAEIAGVQITNLQQIILLLLQILLDLLNPLDDLFFIAIHDELIEFLLRDVVIIRRQVA
ncbi:MAG: hypothetical protein PHG30_07675 [Eubacteriales bacterium]|nr:hypothetical protein [Eubacteriales bacterium]